LARVLQRSSWVPRGDGRIRPVHLIAGFGALGTLLVPGVAAHAAYFNNYYADLATATALLWALIEIDTCGHRRRAAWWTIAALAVLAPWMAQGALLLAPMSVYVLWTIRDDRRLATFSLTAFAISTAVVAWFFLLPVSANGDITDFWKGDSPAAGISTFLRRSGSTFVEFAYPTWVGDSLPTRLVALALTTWGLFVLQRAWRWWIPLYLSAQATALLASIVVGWPATFVRVNSAFQVLVFAAAPVGLAVLVLRAVAHLAARSGRANLAVALATGILILVGVTCWPRTVARNSTSTGVFARGLSADLDVVVSGSEPDDLVVAYHLSAPYVRDRLLNFDDVAPEIIVVDELSEGDDVFDDLDGFVEPSTEAIWCIVPFEAGPDATSAACRPGGEWTETFRTRTTRAVIVRLARPGG
ncbi:MAG: hypothetical protein ACR2O6_04895, partial [Ilumatobacteraceae bacterium]